MSGRSRREKRRAGTGWKWLGVAFAVALLGMAGGYVWLRGWLHGEDFRMLLSREAGKALKAEAEFAPFRWDGLELSSDAFAASGEGVVERLEADGLRLDVGLGKLSEGVVQLRQAKINRVDLRLDLVDGPEAEEAAMDERVADPPAKKRKWYAGFVPREAELTDLEIGRSELELALRAGDASFRGTGWSWRKADGGGYDGVARGGAVRLPWEKVPELELDEARLRLADETVFLNQAVFGLYERGRLELTGEASLRGEGFVFEGNVSDVRADEVLPEDWKQRVEGTVESGFSVGRELGGKMAVEGDLALRNGVLTGLPVLDSLGAYGGSARFRRLALSEATVNFEWRDGVLRVSEIALASEGLVRVTGELSVDREDRLDGVLRVGLTPGTLAWIPGAETQVFLPGERGLLWTTVRVSGTLDDPKEDLTRRLIAAAGLRMFEILPATGERVLKFTDRVVDGDLEALIEPGENVAQRGKSLLERGKRVLGGEENPEALIEEAEDVVKEVEGLLDLFRKRDEPEENKR